MVEVRGFSALRFDNNVTGALDTVLTPPYDVISPSERDALAGRNPYNMTHLILPRAESGQTAYERAALLLHEWRRSGALRQDAAPGYYALRQHFTDPEGVERVRHAFFGLLKLPEAGEHTVLGHERTFGKPVEDRLALIRATRANIEPIFLMYSDPEQRLHRVLFNLTEQDQPLIDAVTADGVRQQVWRVDPAPEVAGHLRDQILFIADGHHRFKTACAYRDEMRSLRLNDNRNAAYDFIMAGFVAFEEPGLKIYAAHRLTPPAFSMEFPEIQRRLEGCFAFESIEPEVTHDDALRQHQDACVFLLYAGKNGMWRLTLDERRRGELVDPDRSAAWQSLDVAVLHQGILNRLLGVSEDVALGYENDAAEAIASVDAGQSSCAFLLRPTRPDQVRACAEAFEPMPQKSTYYFPKLPSGAVMYALDA